MPEPLLALRDVRAGYGDAVVLDDVSFDLPVRGSLAVLGRNGVGKSTLLLTIMGYTDVRRGTVSWRGADITALAPHRRARQGLGWVAQEREVFPSLTVQENLTLAARDGRWDLDAVYRLFPALAARRTMRGHALSGGEQQMLAIARGLMARPRLLMLDEPSLGLAPLVVAELFQTLVAVNRAGVTVLLVEQNVHQALAIAHYGYVLETGRIVRAGTATELLDDPYIKEAYLGL